ncbi:16S rRNA (cytosine(967)-C(5))-methyltransferase RsmB [Lapidilactobacillus luobeiensis]|uniref:16S rRNA (cytosine(967)-C(5))-methyltransferase RsmB n=1 Tax=Lapidilactobacillus luobeiensis TaxID=2950371 RepID=UPI0021C2E446|nr:16S rRNA (cytosine(967)-C(5))-methyltransferase RsmB [Lapidilactobacillus luobeiensis]
MSQPSARQVAADLLENIEAKQQYANLELNHVLNRSHLSSVDQKLVTRLVYGTLQWQMRLDHDWRRFVKKPEQLPLWVHVLLRMSVYQLFFLDKVPDHAILNEATNLAKRRDHGKYARLVNAVLRQTQRQGEFDFTMIPDLAQRLSLTYSVPNWLTTALLAQYGAKRISALYQTLNEPAQASLRVNSVKTTPTELLAELAPTFPNLQLSKLSPVGLVAPEGNFAQTAAFQAGAYTLQDESSQLVAPALQVRASDQVLDACAAPGGKATHLATYLDPDQGGHLTALDIHQHKLQLIVDNAQRLGVAERITTKLLDARQVDQAFADQTFDRVLVDAPCSGLGLLRRKPEIRYAKTAAGIARLPQIQGEILAAVAPKVKSGGYLVYSTCTILAAENQAVIATFLADHPNYVQRSVPVAPQITRSEGELGLQLLMDDEHSDGFFIACLQRID